MAFYAIQKFVGINLNVESGEGVTSPTEVKSLVFDRQGGLIAKYGATSTGATAYTGLGALGYGPDGIYAWQDSVTSTTVHVLDSGTAHSATVYTPQAFVPGVGAYNMETDSGRAKVLIRDASGTYHTTIASNAGTTVSAAAVSGTFTSGSYWVVVNAGVQTKHGLFLRPTFAALRTLNPTTSIVVTVSGTNTSGTLSLVYFGKAGTGFSVTSGAFASIVSGSGTLTWKTVSGSSAYASSLSWYAPQWDAAPVAHWGRVWGTASKLTQLQNMESISMQYLVSPVTLFYTEVGYANMVLYDNWLRVPFQASSAITGLASTPAGLLAFGAHETILVRGDPANAATFEIKPVSAEIGHDSGGEQPAVLGGSVFCIHDKRIYQITLGMGDVDFGTGMSEIGYNVWDASDGFVQVVAEPRWNQLVARTSAGKIYRYDLHTKQWFNDALSGVSLTRMLPNPDSSGTRYLRSSNSHISTVLSGTAATPDVKWEDVDLGDRGLKKNYRRVRIFTNDAYTGTPTLTYNVSGSSGTISGTSKGGGRFIFSLPNGLVGEKADLTVNMAGAATHDQLKAPVVIEFTPRYRQR